MNIAELLSLTMQICAHYISVQCLRSDIPTGTSLAARRGRDTSVFQVSLLISSKCTRSTNKLFVLQIPYEISQ
jgi:hypothetical protein